jgi:putative transposase
MTTYFITACAQAHENLFQRDEVAELMVETLSKYRDAGEFALHDYVVMPDHIHVLVSLNDGRRLSRAVQLIKGGFSHELRQHGILFRAVWEQRYHARRVRDANECAEFSRYIRLNPVRKGLVQCAEDYRYSSAGTLGLKPASEKNSAGDASLKARSTDRHEASDIAGSAGAPGLKPLLKTEEGVDANLKVRSTESSKTAGIEGSAVNPKARSSEFFEMQGTRS